MTIIKTYLIRCRHDSTNRMTNNCSLLLRTVLEPSRHGMIPAWLLGVAIFVGTVLSSSAAFAANAHWYVAAGVGQSRFSGIEAYNPISPNSFGDTDTGYRLSLGYQFNPYLGVEASYVLLGQVTGNSSTFTGSGGGPTCGLPCMQSYDTSAALKTHGWSLEVTGTYPFNNHWAIYARLGGIKAYSELNFDFTPTPPYYYPPASTTSKTSRDTDVTYGLGVRWLFTDHWAVRLS